MSPSQHPAGRISVATPYGRAVSSGDFFIPPSPYTAANVGLTDRMSIGESKTVTTNTPNKIALILFDGSVGQRMSMAVSSAGGSDVEVRKPDGLALYSRRWVWQGSFFDTVALPATGTYTILMDPPDAWVVSMTFRLYEVPPDVTGVITIGGPSVTLTTTKPGQNGTLTFSGTQGQRISMIVTSAGGSDVEVKNPDGTALYTLYQEVGMAEWHLRPRGSSCHRDLHHHHGSARSRHPQYDFYRQ